MMKRRNVGILILLCIALMLMTGCSSTALNVINDNVVIEYGEKISLEASDYLDNKDKVLKNVEVSADIENEAEKDYPAVGEYTINFSYKKQNAKVTVSVVDTTKPEFVDFKDSVDIYQNSKIDFNTVYNVDDLSNVEITVDESSVDYTTAGSYIATVTATDDYGNAEAKKVTVNVLPVTVALNTNTSTINVGSTAQLEAIINVPDGKATFTSSDSAIATVDENGLVTGVSAGNTTIYAELNGVKAECTVTVKVVKSTTASSSSKSSSSNNSSSSSDAKNAQALAVAQQIANEIMAAGGSDLDKVTAAAKRVQTYCKDENYTMKGENYRTPYGVFITGEWSCAGATRATGMILELMGFSWKHVNENQYTHQWCVVYNVDGQTAWADGNIGQAGYGQHWVLSQ